MGQCVLTAVVLLGLALAVAAPASGQPPLPMEQSAAWVYEATVKWTPRDSGQVQTKRLKWTTEVISRVEHPGIIVAVIRGIPFELSWYEEGRQPGYSLMAWMNHRVYAIPMKSEAEARQAARRFPRLTESLLKQADMFLDMPLKAGKRYACEVERQDNWYCWYVEHEEQFRGPIKGWKPDGPAAMFRLAYRTNPDHRVVEFVPGLGVVRYFYRHHGTVAEADLQLVEFRPGAASGPAPGKK